MHDAARSESIESAPLRNSRVGEERLDSENAQAFAAVQALLIGDERGELAALRNRIDRIERSDADTDLRREQVAAVLADALKQANLKDGDKIGEVLGPSIGEGIRHQLKNERPAMVAALVPMVGTLVAGAVAEAMDKLSNGINHRMDRLFSLDGLKLATRAKLGGGSLHDALVADMRRAAVERLFLFNRITNRLDFTWPDREEGLALSDRTADEILHGVLGLSGDILVPGDHALRSVVIGDRHLVLRAGVTHTVVIEVSGALTDTRRATLGEACFEMLDFVSNLTDDIEGAEIDEEVIAPFAARLVYEADATPRVDLAPRRFNPALVLGVLLGLALIAFIGWRLYDGWRIGNRAAAVETHIEQAFAPGSLMLSVAPDRSEGTISVLGVALAAANRTTLEARAIELANPYTLDFEFIAADPAAAGASLAMVRTEIDDLRRSTTLTGDALSAIDRKAGNAAQALRVLRDPARLLAQWIDTNAIFFTIGSEYAAPSGANAALDALAAHLARAPDRPLRVIGYADATGSPDTNLRAATARAATVATALETRGIPTERLIVLGRTGPETAISPRNGTGSPNRRVQFELGFVGEAR